MNRATQMALMAGAGYLLGRRRKLRVALVLGTAVAAGRLSGDPRPRALLRRGAKALGGPGELGKLAGLGAPLVAATKAAATSAVTRRVDAVSDGLRRRAEVLREPRKAESDAAADESDESPVDAPQPRRRPTQAGRRGQPGRRGRSPEPDDAEDGDTEPDELADDYDADDLRDEDLDGRNDEGAAADDDYEDEDEPPPVRRRPARGSGAATPVRRRSR